MGWDKKHGIRHRFYYGWRRSEGGWKKCYVGRGAAAERVAQLDAQAREARLAARRAWHAEQLQLAQADDAVEQAWQLVHLLFQITMIVHGCYFHHGFWRRRGQHAQEGQGKVHPGDA